MTLYLLIHQFVIIYIYIYIFHKVVQNILKRSPPPLYVVKKKITLLICVRQHFGGANKNNVTVYMHWFPWKPSRDSSS